MKIPAILNRIASAETGWVNLEDDPSGLRELEICRAWGFPVNMAGGRAQIEWDHDALVPVWVESETESIAWEKVRVHGFLEIGSTNDEALTCSRAGAPEGTLIYAERQTAGKGRLGRRWISPASAGLYFTLVLRPRQPLSRWPLLALVASFALLRSLQDLRTERLIPKDLDIDLKWPNDVLLSGKKTAGILLETAFRGESADAAVVGVGVNITPESVPADLSDHATAIELEAGVSVPRRWLLVRFLNHFQRGYRLFSTGSHSEIIEQWKCSSTMWKNIEIVVTEGDRIRPAVTCGLTDTGALRIRTEDGSEETLLAGDVSIRRR